MVPSTVETLHELLAADGRRDALAALVESNRPLTRRELARRVAARRRDGSWNPDDHPDRPVDKLGTELHHRHLPPLLDAGVVTRSESDLFAATEAGCDLHRAERAFRAVVGGGDEPSSSAGRTACDDVAEGPPASGRTSHADVAERSSVNRETASGDASERLVLPVSWDAVEAVDYLVESDERWTSHPGYDEAIRTAVLEASK